MRHLLLAMAIAAAALPAKALVFNPTDQGMVASDGFSLRDAGHGGSFISFTGFTNDPGREERRHWFIFNVGAFDGVIASAQLVYPRSYAAADASVTLGVFDLSAPNRNTLDASANIAGGLAGAFADAGAGQSYGSIVLNRPASGQFVPSPNINLTIAALNDINAARLNSDHRIGLATRITSGDTAGDACHCVGNAHFFTPQLVVNLANGLLGQPLSGFRAVGNGEQIAIDAGTISGDTGAHTTSLGAEHGLDAQSLPGTAAVSKHNTVVRSFLFDAPAPQHLMIHGNLEGLLAADHGAIARVSASLRLYDHLGNLIDEDLAFYQALPTGSQMVTGDIDADLLLDAILTPGRLYRLVSELEVFAQSTALGAARALFANTFEYSISGLPANPFADPNRQTTFITESDAPPGQVPEAPTVALLGLAAAALMARRRHSTAL